jgi:membrane protease YdiL (CAAX protease family)
VAVAAISASTLTSVAFVAALGSAGGSALLLTSLAFEVSLAMFTVLWVAVRHRGWVPALGLRSERARLDVPLGAFVGVGLWAALRYVVVPVVVVVWNAILGRPPGSPNQLPGVDFGVVEIVLGVLLLVVVTPIGEVVFYRGFLFTALRGRVGVSAAAVISAAFFGLSHLAAGAVLVPVLFVFGFVQALVFQRRRSLVAPIAAHGVFNLIALVRILMERL